MKIWQQGQGVVFSQFKQLCDHMRKTQNCTCPSLQRTISTPSYTFSSSTLVLVFWSIGKPPNRILNGKQNILHKPYNGQNDKKESLGNLKSSIVVIAYNLSTIKRPPHCLILPPWPLNFQLTSVPCSVLVFPQQQNTGLKIKSAPP